MNLRNKSLVAYALTLYATLLPGLNDAQLEWLGSEDSVIKTSRRDLPYVISQVGSYPIICKQNCCTLGFFLITPESLIHWIISAVILRSRKVVGEKRNKGKCPTGKCSSEHYSLVGKIGLRQKWNVSEVFFYRLLLREGTLIFHVRDLISGKCRQFRTTPNKYMCMCKQTFDIPHIDLLTYFHQTITAYAWKSVIFMCAVRLFSVLW